MTLSATDLEVEDLEALLHDDDDILHGCCPCQLTPGAIVFILICGERTTLDFLADGDAGRSRSS